MQLQLVLVVGLMRFGRVALVPGEPQLTVMQLS